MKKKLVFRGIIFSTIFLFCIAASHSVKAQSVAHNNLHEIYGELNGEFFKGNSELYNTFIELLTKRINIVEELYVQNEKYEKISSLNLLNKYNTSISHESFKTVDEFNPLKYQMDFFAKTTKVYRIDNTNLIVVIDPQ